MVIAIRRLRMSDYAAIIEVLRVCHLNPRVRGRESRRNLAKQLRSKQTLYLGAFDGPQLVGTVFGTHDTRKGWINRLAVLPEYRRAGIAARLVRECERGLRKYGLEMFAALIEAENTPSRSLFAKLGYTPSDILYYRIKDHEDV
ncbi:MAG TPA: GNAT family N-acetyltransferase [Thermoplasmata archaeon]|nr:GNAT family N-acetyltransferase [Thermoplasmata archaeon]